MGITGSTNQDNKFFGFRLYKIFEGGPLGNSGLTELDDFIIPPEEVIYNKISFYEFIKNNLNKNLTLNIYSTVRRFIYSIEVIPRNDWGDQRNGLLGACVRYENWATAHTNLLRVIKVKQNSVAEKYLKMIPLEDFIISIRPENKDFITLNKDTSDPMTIFHEVLQDNIGNFIEIFIYNIKTGPRSVKLFLEQKNGEILGCDVAYGKLHELPKIVDEENDKNLKFKENTEMIENIKNEDYVLEETKKILMENIQKKQNYENNNTKGEIKYSLDAGKHISSGKNEKIISKTENKGEYKNENVSKEKCDFETINKMYPNGTDNKESMDTFTISDNFIVIETKDFNEDFQLIKNPNKEIKDIMDFEKIENNKENLTIKYKMDDIEITDENN